MTAEVLDLASAFCPTTGVKVEEKSDSNIYDLWLGSAVADEESSCTIPPQPLVAATITLEAIQNLLWANGFPIDPPSTSDVGPGPFEDTQFDVVVDVETTDDVKDDKEYTCIGNNSSPVYESDLSEEDLSGFLDVPLSPVLSVMSDKEFDLSGCDSGIEAEFDDPHEMEEAKSLKNAAGCSDNGDSSCTGETEVTQKNDTASVEGCDSCKKNQTSTWNGEKVEVKTSSVKKSSSDRKDSEESLDFKCQFLWEFLQHLLADKKYNNCIVWKNERRGIFRLTDHQRVANLWGRVKKRKNMTYDKLSRALRYYYSRNILKKVDGQRLTYKFCKNLDGKKFAS